METKTELVPRHHSAHSDTLVPPSHPSSHTGHSSAHVKQAFFRICFKVPVYSPGVVPKHHAPYNTPFIRSFFAFFFYFCFFFLYINHPWFFIRDFVPSFFFSKTSQSAFTPGLTEAQDMVQNGMLWLEHTPPISCRARSTRKLVRTQHIPSVKLRPAQRCLFMCRARWSDLEKHLSQ